MSFTIDDNMMKSIGDVDNYWGDLMPIMATEELAECIQAISKLERAHMSPTYASVYRIECKEEIANTTKEISDVFISLLAICHHYDIKPDDIKDRMIEKLAKKY